MSARGAAEPSGPQLEGQTVLVIGGSAGIGLATAKRARAEGAELILTGRNPNHLREAAAEVGARSTAAFDAEDDAALERFFAELDGPLDHVMVTAGSPYYAPLDEIDFAKARAGLTGHPMLMVGVCKFARGKVRDGGALIFIGGTGARRPAPGLALAGAITAALPAMAANLALEVAPLRVNLIAPGFVDTPLSASLLGDGLEARREQLRESLPIGRVIGPDDVAALAIHLMANTALTGATYDIDGGQQFVPRG
jgi:NAD(P)-dependent dehydrogenase (short-subunit alcohol dehydrogenase family)